MSALAVDSPLISDIPHQFWPDFEDDAEAVGGKPKDAVQPLMNESNLKSWSLNPNGHAAGIFQAMPATLKGLGYPGTWDTFVKLNADEQLPWFRLYYWPYRGRLINATAWYMATFTPAFLVHASEPDWVIAGKSGPHVDVYNANTSFDHWKEGLIRVKGLTESIRLACQGPRWEAISAALDETMATRATIAPPALDVTDGGTNAPVWIAPDPMLARAPFESFARFKPGTRHERDIRRINRAYDLFGETQ